MTTTQEALREFLIASSEHTAAMYDLGFAMGAGNPRGPAERNLEETAAAFITARVDLEKAMQHAMLTATERNPPNERAYRQAANSTQATNTAYGFETI